MSTLVVVTGGSSGLGAALLATAPEGARLVDVSRRGPGGVDRDVEHLAADLADPQAWPGITEALGGHLRGDVDRVVLWHAAGTIEPIGFAGEVDPQAYARAVLLNTAAGQVLGAAFLAAVADRPAARRELGLISSGAAQRGYPGWSAYGPGKAALDHWARTVHAEQRERGGVRVVSVAPGVVATPMQERIRETDPADFPAVGRFVDLHATGALADAGEVARRLWALLDEPDPGPVTDLRER